MRRRVIAIVVLLTLGGSCFHLHAGADTRFATIVRVEKSQSPDGALALAILTANGGPRLALVSLNTRAVLANVALPNPGPVFGEAGIKTSLIWKRDSTGVAVSFSDKKVSSIFVCVKVKGGRYKWLDLRVAEGPNLGMLGRPRSDFERIEDTPTRWVDESDHTPRMVYVRTRFWDKHRQRYTIEQEFSISPVGEIGWK